MSFAINLQELRDRASKRAATIASVATLLPDDGSKVAGVATVVDEDAPASAAWTDADIAGFLSRRDRLMRWGWPEPDAEALAERLTRRDREGDDRVSCAGDCANYRPGRCADHRLAGLHSAVVGGDLATTFQRCPGFKP